MKKILLSLAAIFVCLSSFATEAIEKKYSFEKTSTDDGYLVKYETNNYHLFFVIVDYKIPNVGVTTEQKADYIAQANNKNCPIADTEFSEVSGKQDDLWTAVNPTTLGLGNTYTCYKFNNTKVSDAAKSDTRIKTNYEIANTATVVSRSTDYADHYVLYLQLREGETVADSDKYSIDVTDNTVTGKIDLTVDENAAVEVYNLSGVRMQGDNLPAGVYIRRQGNKVSKYVVR
jgi:hypothetical protein